MPESIAANAASCPRCLVNFANVAAMARNARTEAFKREKPGKRHGFRYLFIMLTQFRLPFRLQMEMRLKGDLHARESN